MATEETTQAGSDDLMSFDEIVAAQGVEFVKLEGWDGKKIGIASITAGEILEWIEQREDPTQRKTAGLRLIARSLSNGKKVDPDGRKGFQRLCDTPEKEQKMVDSLIDKDSKSINRIVRDIAKLNGIDEKPEAVKND